MPIQFSGTLDPGQYRVWSTWGWSREFDVYWSVRPGPGQVGTVSLRALAVEAADDGTLTYKLTVWNVGTNRIDFDALYAMTTTAQTVFDDASGDYLLDPAQTIDLSWDFGVAPTLINLIPVPQDAGASFECSTPSVVLNADGTATYSFTVTNTGTKQAAFRLRASLS